MRPTRREMLRVGLSGLTAVGLGGTMPALVSKFAHAAKPQAPTAIADDNVFVIVQLTGGNDGLNTVVPTGNDAYRKARPTIGLSDGLHRLDDAHALNPAMTAFKELFDAGKLAVINGCGYPQPSRSHFAAMEMWHTASDANAQTSGWLGHYLDHVQRGTPGALKAVNVGAELPQALVADRSVVPSIQTLDDLAGANVSAARQCRARRANDAIVDADAIRKVTARYRPDASYPGGLGQPLRLIAQLIAAQMGTKLFYCQIGGFDTHASQLA